MSEQSTINALKGLVIDGVDRAKSGHPGGALSSMDFAYVLYTEFLKFDPDHPDWLGRDRFILSAGHESMLLYSLLHGVGWLNSDDLKSFRQLHSRTPGHPENTITPGVECTTGPLGQGAAMSVGMASAALHWRARLDDKLFDQKVYALLGDGCMQEDVTLGAASLAGHWRLGNLIWYYDRNKCQISGEIDRVTSDDETRVFEGFGWEVVTIDGHDRSEIRKVLRNRAITRGPTDKPLLIIGNTKMGQGLATMEGDHETHGAPLPAEERKLSRDKLGLPTESPFYWPQEAQKEFQRNFVQLRELAQTWRQKFDQRRKSDSNFDRLYTSSFEKKTFDHLAPVPWTTDKAIASRSAFGKIIEFWQESLPNLVGGSADLEPSNMTGPFAKKVGDFQWNSHQGRNFAFGVREFPMSAICNGLALFGGLIPFDATFLTFSDYARPALRLGAIQKVRVIHEYTHDSFYLGEDGPTHQPIEHLMALRAMPDLYVMRPADAKETEILMRVALGMSLPSAFCLTRQNLPFLQLPEGQINLAARGAYVVSEAENGAPDMIIIATGSEVSLALETKKQLRNHSGIRVVSMPCWELFNEQDAKYRESVLPKKCTKRIAIEAGTTMGWHRYVGIDGLVIGVDTYGHSAPAGELAKYFGFTSESICEKINAHPFE